MGETVYTWVDELKKRLTSRYFKIASVRLEDGDGGFGDRSWALIVDPAASRATRASKLCGAILFEQKSSPLNIQVEWVGM